MSGNGCPSARYHSRQWGHTVAVTEQPTTCSRCGRVRDTDPLAALAWVSERGDRGDQRWLCPGCARAHARDIESKLDQSWW